MPTKAELEQQVATLTEEVEQMRAQVKNEPGLVVRLPEVDQLPDNVSTYHVNVHLGKREAAALGGLAIALDRAQTVLSSGRRVTDRRHAAQWLFEQLHDVCNGGERDSFFED